MAGGEARLVEHPTEFGAFILCGDGVVRVYLNRART
jgi:hypothetical protein